MLTLYCSNLRWESNRLTKCPIPNNEIRKNEEVISVNFPLPSPTPYLHQFSLKKQLLTWHWELMLNKKKTYFSINFKIWPQNIEPSIKCPVISAKYCGVSSENKCDIHLMLFPSIQTSCNCVPNIYQTSPVSVSLSMFKFGTADTTVNFFVHLWQDALLKTQSWLLYS